MLCVVVCCVLCCDALNFVLGCLALRCVGFSRVVLCCVVYTAVLCCVNTFPTAAMFCVCCCDVL